mgnify:CR=1 FL=1
MDARNPMGSSTKNSIGKIPIGFNPMNLTTNVGKNPKDSNPPKVPWNSFESKEPSNRLLLTFGPKYRVLVF